MGLLPIGFFAPLPLPVMIPFMAMQSFSMAYAFGTGFQYGKRKISAMSNDDFNALTPVDLNAHVLGSIHDMIPSFQQSSKDMEIMMPMILESMRKMISDSTQYFSDIVANMFKGIGTDITDFFQQTIPMDNTSLESASPPATTTDLTLVSHTDTLGGNIFTPEKEKLTISDAEASYNQDKKRWSAKYNHLTWQSLMTELKKIPASRQDERNYIKTLMNTSAQNTAPTRAHTEIDTRLSDWLTDINRDIEILMKYKTDYNIPHQRNLLGLKKNFNELKGRLILKISRAGRQLAGVPNANTIRNGLTTQLRNLRL